VALVVVLALINLGVGAGVGASLARQLLGSRTAVQAPIHTVPQVPTAPRPATGQALDLRAIAAKVSPAVVDINTTLSTANGRTAEAAGTGIILTSSGQVLTNNHVVDGASSLKVTIQGRSGSYTAKVLGTSPTSDVALIQIDGVSGLPAATLADSSTLAVGQGVVAIGNALGQGGSPAVTQGTITALDQAITASTGGRGAEQLTGLIQSDAPISPGDSGGPLANTSGQVVGMITAGESQGLRQTTSTVGYAIPASTALDVVNQIRAGKSSSTVIIGPPGYLGVGVNDLTPTIASRLNVSSGALVVQVAPGSPADKAGISQNSVITAIDGTSITSANSLGPAIQSHKPGQQARVSWVDQNGSHTATVTMTSRP
jgi:S1-C subfamily serine protease